MGWRGAAVGLYVRRMTTDQVVAALAEEGYDRERVWGVINAFADIPWRESEDWSERDIRVLRRQLGEPEYGPDLSFDLDTWAADLRYVIDRTTGGRAELTFQDLRRIAGELLHQSADGAWLPEATKARLNEHGPIAGQYDPAFTVERWAPDLAEAVARGTSGRLRLDDAASRVAANLLLHACEGDWMPQAARIRLEYAPGQRSY